MTTSNITFGYYANNRLSATLQVTDGDQLLPASEMAIDVTVPAFEGAVFAEIVIALFNMDGGVYGALAPVDLPVGEPIHFVQAFEPVITNNYTYDLAPGTSRISIDSISWLDADYNYLKVEEGMDHWDWYRNQADAPVGAVPAYLVQ